uniref:Putative 22.5 kDa secreted protein n=1 Tax=Ixodes scapularis TaxID=6945 RepID=Q8MV98_IXOSC|nr:putative 22.5 kDa secreted protein [Ixodes scapularis]
MEVMHFSFLLCLLAILVDAKPGEIRIDEDEKYWQYQDIQRALNNPDRESWLYYRTYRRETDGSEHICVSAKVSENQPNGSDYEFVQEYRLGTKEQNTRKTVTLYATPYKTEMHATQRQNNNAMRVSQKKDAQDGKGYQLIYSDYNKCDILRVLRENSGHDCELYLHSKALDDGVPRECESVYGIACGKDEPSYKQRVYYPWCKENMEGTI